MVDTSGWERFEKTKKVVPNQVIVALKKQYPHNRYGAKTDKFKIRFYETNKIRKLLSRYYNTGGYPVKFNSHVGYYSGIAVWVPDQWSISGKETRNMWNKYPYSKWVSFVMFKVDIYDNLQDEVISHGAKTLGSLAIPIFGGIFGASYSQNELNITLSTRTFLPVYPNVLFYNTLHDNIIWANWNLVFNDLQIIEKEKYLPPLDEVVVPFGGIA